MRSKLVNLKVTPKEYKQLVMNAKAATNGNLSAYLRDVGLTYTAKKKKAKKAPAPNKKRH